MHKLAPSALLALVLVTSVAGARADDAIAVDGGLAFYSTYAWRGYEVAAAPSVQPNLTFSFAETGLWFDVWGAAAASDREEWDWADEIDLTLGYDREFGFGPQSAWWSAGYVYYGFPRLEAGESKTQEVFAAFGLDTFLSPSLNVFYDFDLIDGFYVSPSISHAIPVAPLMAIDVSASLGVTDALVASDGGTDLGWQDLTLGASLDIPVANALVTPELGYSFAEASINPDEHLFWGGVRLGFGF